MYRNKYTEFMEDAIKKGYAEVVSDQQAKEGRKWYVPYHGVFHPK
jgi:hypothetical protein